MRAAARTDHSACPPVTECDHPAAELRAQLKAEGRNSPGTAAFLGRFDLVRDGVLDTTRRVTRICCSSTTPFPRIGSRSLPGAYSRPNWTIRFTHLFAHQTVTFGVFAFFGLSEEDRYLIPSLRYAFSDSLWAEAGANLFGGKRDGMFGSMRDNNNVYLTVRYAF